MSYLRSKKSKASKTHTMFNQEHGQLKKPVYLRRSSAFRDDCRNPDEGRIQSLLVAISNRKFKYYVKSSFQRGRGLYRTPMQVAVLNGLNIDECLFEVKDHRIEEAAIMAGMEIVTAKSHRPDREEGTRVIHSWRAED